MLTLQQQFWTTPLCLFHPQQVIPTQLLVQLTSPLPPPVLRVRPPTLRRPFSAAPLEPGRAVHRHPGRLDKLQGTCIPINQIKVRCLTKSDLYSLPSAFLWLGSFTRPSRFFAQRHNLWTSSLYRSRQARRLPVPRARRVVCRRAITQLHGVYENSKATYWSRIFLCNGLVVCGVSRCLGHPSGGVRGWWSHV